jgi:rhodanese-related sulfurtransferase
MKLMADTAYAGDLAPEQAWDMLKREPTSVLVDVRTQPELLYVGIPDLSSLDKAPVFVPWKVFPKMEVNSDFVRQVAASGVDPDTPLLFLCRSGGRSKEAAIAMTQAGYKKCYNVAQGFEGDLDPVRHRNTIGGWRHNGLPWVQT